jgi:EAL domain-containing protein (putative c-di-GMP-specific phosphodiesterase class I)
VKLDMNLIHSVQQPSRRETIKQIVEECHRFGAMSLAEGVESEDIFNAVKDLGVDLFQGYYFGQPVPVESVKAKTAAHG